MRHRQQAQGNKHATFAHHASLVTNLRLRQAESARLNSVLLLMRFVVVLPVAAGPITAATLPGIERLTALENLELESCQLEAFCLLPMTTGLTRVYLESVTLQPEQTQQGGGSGTSQLLQLLARLTALQELRLDSVDGEWPQQQLALYSGG
jgi:hypothetical protein